MNYHNWTYYAYFLFFYELSRRESAQQHKTSDAVRGKGKNQFSMEFYYQEDEKRSEKMIILNIITELISRDFKRVQFQAQIIGQ